MTVSEAPELVLKVILRNTKRLELLENGYYYPLEKSYRGGAKEREGKGDQRMAKAFSGDEPMCCLPERSSHIARFEFLLALKDPDIKVDKRIYKSGDIETLTG